MSLNFSVGVAIFLTIIVTVNTVLFIIEFIKEIKKSKMLLDEKQTDAFTKLPVENKSVKLKDVHSAIKLFEGMTQEDAEAIAIHALADELIKNKELVHFEKVWRQWDNLEKASTERAEWLVACIKLVEEQK